MGSSNDSSVESSNDDVVIKEDLITYSKNQLIALKEVSLSTEWPSYLDEGFKNNRGHWDPDRWHQNKRRGSTPPPEEKGGNGTTKDDVSAPGNKASLTSLFLQHSNFQKSSIKNWSSSCFLRESSFIFKHANSSLVVAHFIFLLVVVTNLVTSFFAIYGFWETQTRR